MMDFSTSTPMWCDNQETSTCFYPSENLVWTLDHTFGTIVLFLAVIIMISVAKFFKSK